MKKENFFSYCLVLLMSCFFLVGCQSFSSKQIKKIGVDPLWYNLNVTKLDARIFGFVENFLLLFSKNSRFVFERYKDNWDNLTYDLDKNNFDAIIAQIEMTNINKAKYDVSEIFLENGPVLVYRKQNKISSLKQMKNAHIAVPNDNYALLILPKNPTIIIEKYDSIAQILDRISKDEIDGAVIDYLPAQVYISNIYPTQLKMTDPIESKGLRLIVKKNTNLGLLRSFNRIVTKFSRNGRLEKLKKKWELD